MATEHDIALPVSVSMRTYFSTYHRWAAERFARNVENIEDTEQQSPRFDIEHRAYAIASILSSVAFIEAAINELLKDAADQHTSYLSSVSEDIRSAWAELWIHADKKRIPTLTKYQEALTRANAELFDEQDDMYRNVKLATNLRNMLVHYKPESRSANYSEEITRTLSGKFPENTLMAGSGNPYFPDKCLGAGCCWWALKSVRCFSDSFHQKIDVVPNYQRVFTNASSDNS